MRHPRAFEYGIALLNYDEAARHSSVNGKYDNDPDVQTILKTALIDYFNGMARRKAINGFDSDKIVIADGVEINAVTVDVAVRLLGSMEFAYINVNLNR